MGIPTKKPMTRKTTLKLKPKSKTDSQSKPSQNKQSEEEESAPTDEGIYDSVELSFMGKLEKADKKDTEDQRVFELLEEAALDSSFCSTSSTVKKLIDNASSRPTSMPSPIAKRTESQTSTPKLDRNQAKVKHSLARKRGNKHLSFLLLIHNGRITFFVK